MKASRKSTRRRTRETARSLADCMSKSTSALTDIMSLSVIKTRRSRTLILCTRDPTQNEREEHHIHRRWKSMIVMYWLSRTAVIKSMRDTYKCRVVRSPPFLSRWPLAQGRFCYRHWERLKQPDRYEQRSQTTRTRQAEPCCQSTQSTPWPCQNFD